MKQAKLLIRVLIVVCFFTTSTLSYAAEVSKGEEKGQMPEGSESTGDAKDAVDNKNEVSEAEKEQSEEEDEQSEDSEKDDEEEAPRGSSILRIQASKSDTDTVQGWLENLLGRALNLNNPNDQTILDFWSGLLDQGYTLNQVQSLIDTVGVLKDAIDYWYNGSFFQMGQVNLDDISDLQALFNWANLINLGFTQLNVKMMVILVDIFMEGVKDNLIHRNLDLRNARDIKILAGWAQYMREGYSGNEVYNLFKNQMSPSITALLGSFNVGFFTYMAEDALSKINGGLDYACNLLDAMVGVKNGVEALIGPVDILNAPYEDNGFLTYWAEQALNLGVNEVNQILYIWNQILPTIEEFEGKNLNLFNPEESGIVSFWAGKVQEFIDGGMGLEDAITEAIELILHQGEVILTPTQEALIPYVEGLIGKTFDVDNPNHMGFLSYWAERATAEGLQGIKDLLDAMADVLASVEALIGPIDLFDENDPGNGFLTHWAERAIAEGVAQVNQTLYIWGQLIPSIEQKLGRVLDLFNGDDSGVVGYWTSEVQTRVDASMALGNAITEVIALILQVAPVTYDELIPYIEDLIDITFDENNPEHMGFLTYWSQQADIEGLTNIQDLLAVMVDIKDEVEALIGPLDLLDQDAQDDGFLTSWANKAVNEGVANVETLLDAMINILPAVEALIGPIDFFDINDPGNGYLGYWAGRAVNEGSANIITLFETMADILPSVENLIGPIDLFDENDPGNGFLSYWAERAINEGVAQVDQTLYVWGQLIPSIEQKLDRVLNLYDSGDTGIIGYWADEVQTRVDGGMGLEDAIAEVIELILQAEPSRYDELIPYIEDLLSIVFDENNDQHLGFLTYWSQRADLEGLSNIESFLSAMVTIKDEIEALVGPINLLDQDPQDDGFFSYWTERAITEGVANIEALLSAMAAVIDSVESLIGNIDLFDGDNDDNGFITYWAEQALNLGVNEVNQILYIWNELIPAIEEYEERTLNLFNADDSGIVSFWAGKVQEFIDGGMGLEDAITEVIELILHQGEVALTPTQEALIPYVEGLIGKTFDVDNPNHMGFLSYWAERANTEGLQGIKDLLDAMADVLASVEALIGSIDLFDENDPGNGFLTYWAERAITEGVGDIEALLNSMAAILPSVEALIGNVNLFDTDYSDNGFLSYWAERAVIEGNTNIIALLNAMAAVLPEVEALIGNVDFFDTDYSDNGYLSYWSERAMNEGAANITTLLQAIASILPSVEALIGNIDLFDENDPGNGFLSYWAERAIAEGVATIQALLDAMATILPEVEALIGVVDFFDNNYEDNGFLSYWAEYAVANGVPYTENVLSNMDNILNNDFDNNGTSEAEELIGAVDFFDNNYNDNGFITYWAQEAVSSGVGAVNQGLYIWKRLLPQVETHEGISLNLFIGDDAGILSFWMNEVLKLINEDSLGLEEAIQEIINRLSEGLALASFLYETANSIANFFEEGIGVDSETGLPYSWITFTEDEKIYQPSYTSISDIGMYLSSLVSLFQLDKISQEELNLKVTQLLNTLNTLQTYSPTTGDYQGKSYFFNYYEVPSKDITINTFLSSIDNTNLVMGLILAREACPNLANSLNELIDKIDLGFFYDQTEHLFLGGYSYNPLDGSVTASGYHYGVLNTETRLISYLALGKSDISEAEALLSLQTLAANMLTAYGIDVVASYGGSLFEFLFPSLFIDEASLSPDGFGLNFKKATLVQQLQAIENGYPFWGEAPCYNNVYEYGEFGSPAGLNPYPSSGILSPYTVMLAFNGTGQGGDLIQLIEDIYPGSINSTFGLIDAIDIGNDLGIYLNSALLQGIALTAITNSLNNGIRGLFAGTVEYAKIASLIENKSFFTETNIDNELASVHDAIADAVINNEWQIATTLFNYFKDIVTTYGKEADFPDLAQLEIDVNQALENGLATLYNEAENLLNTDNYQEAIVAFETILYYNPDYQNARGLLDLARGERDAAVIIPNLDTLITAFEEGNRPNQYISKIGPIDGPNGDIDVEIVSDNDITHGKAIRLDYELEPGGYNGIYMNIDNLELSNTGKLVFDIKGDSLIGIPGKIKIELHPEGSTWPYPSIEIDSITGDWQTIEIDLNNLVPSLNANFILEQIAVILEGNNVGNNQGAILIDNIGFKD